MPRVQLKPKTAAAKPVAKAQPKKVAKPPVTVKTEVKKKSPVQVKRDVRPQQHEITGLSLKQIWRATPALMRNNSKDVVLRKLAHVRSKLGMPAVKVKAQSVERGARVLYDVVVIGKEKDLPLYKQKHVLVSCSCPNHCFMWEYALTQWGSSQIKYSNGEPAHSTNPGNVPGCCKHTAAVITVIMENKF